MTHAAQLEAVGQVEDLLVQLRATRTDRHRFEFQRELLAAMLRAQKKQAEASRNVKRASGQATTSSAVTSELAVEQLVWDRIVRQLRSVGDAFAWRLFGFDRRFILAFSENDPVSPFVGKAGLQHEIDAVEKRWHELGQFSLLHDLTSVIRIGDVTVFTPGGPQLLDDIKANPANRRSSQSQRAKRALAVLNKGAPLLTKGGEEYDLVVSSQQFKTHLPALRAALETADRERLSWVRLAHQLVVRTFSVMAPELSTGEERPTPVEVVDSAAKRQSVVFKKAGLDQTVHHLYGRCLDTHTLDAGLAPYTIYPFSSSMCARLASDYLVVETVLGWDRLAKAFSKLAYETYCPLDEAKGPLCADTPVIEVAKGNRTMTIDAYGLQQLQFELLDVDRFVAAVDEVWERGLGGERRRSGVLTFANERGVWR